jgi:proteic killer suppression protein
MIVTFRSKALKRLFEENDRRGVRPDMVNRVRLILGALDVARSIEGMNAATFRLHSLKGDLKGFWAVTVRANWRIVFRFEDGKAFDVDLIDYH